MRRRASSLVLSGAVALTLAAIAAPLVATARGQSSSSAAPGADGWAVDFRAEAPQAAPAGGRLSWQIQQNPNGPITALILDPVRQVFAVYHVDPGSGEIKLRSVRNLSHDLRLQHHNTSLPAPKDIQQMLEDSRGGGS